MAWYFISLNALFVAMVLVAICGLHLAAIVTQRRDWPGWDRKTAGSGAAPQRAVPSQLVPELAVS